MINKRSPVSTRPAPAVRSRIRPALAAGLVVVMVLAGCAGLRPRWDSKVEPILNEQNKMVREIKTFRGVGRIKISYNGDTEEHPGAVISRSKGQVRLDLFDPAGLTAFSLRLDGDRVQIILPHERSIYGGRINELAFLPPAGLAAPDLAKALFGVLPGAAGAAPIKSPDDENGLRRVILTGETPFTAWADMKTMHFVKAKYGGRQGDDSDVFTLGYDHFRPAGDYRLPTYISVKTPQGAGLEFFLDETTPNPELPDHLFALIQSDKVKSLSRLPALRTPDSTLR